MHVVATNCINPASLAYLYLLFVFSNLRRLFRLLSYLNDV